MTSDGRIPGPRSRVLNGGGRGQGNAGSITMSSKPTMARVIKASLDELYLQAHEVGLGELGFLIGVASLAAEDAADAGTIERPTPEAA